MDFARVRTNVEILRVRLEEVGYVFAHPESVWIPPARDEDDRIAELEAHIGRLPRSLDTFLTTVGHVDFSGSHPDWRHPYPDPLVVAVDYAYARRNYDERREGGWLAPDGAFELVFAPDYLHKADVSGGAPYAVAVPSDADDALVVNEHHETTFTEYLRLAFAAAGFPGWARPPYGESQPPPFPPELRALAAELEPL